MTLFNLDFNIFYFNIWLYFNSKTSLFPKFAFPEFNVQHELSKHISIVVHARVLLLLLIITFKVNIMGVARGAQRVRARKLVCNC